MAEDVSTWIAKNFPGVDSFTQRLAARLITQYTDQPLMLERLALAVRDPKAVIIAKWLEENADDE